MEDLLRQTEATAASQHKNILVAFSASWCGPCHLLQTFLADPLIDPVFDRHFVTLVLIHGEHPDDKRHHDTLGVDEMLDSFLDTGTSLPLMVVLNSNGEVVIDSVRPVYGPRNIHANIGFPTGPNGIEWFLEMLHRAAPSLTPNETDTIRTWLLRHSSDEAWEPNPKK